MDEISQKSLDLHYALHGKIEVIARKRVETREDLSLLYTPGVAQPCREIQADYEKSFALTRRSNLVAVITDGSAVLGLGDIGPAAGMPVMEGKCALFKEFGDVDAIPLCVDTKDVDKLVETIALISKSFGGINLEDIAAPRCFEVERRLKEVCDIPVFHDDQHGTAIVVAAALLNAVKVTGKEMGRVNIVINGAGAAGIAIAKLLLSMGFGTVTLCDIHGIICEGDEGLTSGQEEMSHVTNPDHLHGTLADALNWAGISEDDFNAKLAACSTEQERNQLITDTLSQTYQGATEAFKANNEQVMAAREAQAQLDEAMGKLGGAVSNVKTKLMGEFAPAIADIASAFVDFTNGVDGAEEQLQVSVQNMVDKIVEKLPEFLSFGVDIIVAIVKGLIQNLPYLLEQAPGIIMQLAEAFLELGTALWDVSEELMDQLWEGLMGVWNSIGAWVQDKVDWLADKLFFWRSASDEMSGGSDSDGSHASGLPFVPYDGYKAILHRGEAVLNSTSVAELMDAVRRGQPEGSTTTIVINITETLDGQVLSRRQYKYNQREQMLRGGSLVGVGT